LDLRARDKGRKGQLFIQFFKFLEFPFQIDEDAGAGEADVLEGVVPTQGLEEIQAARTDEIRGIMKELAGRYGAGFSKNL